MDLSQVRSRAAASAMLVASAVLASMPFASSAFATDGEFELRGAWHVTVHYRDAESENPDIDRWDDKVWRFEQRGSRLEWTEFPIVLFNDRSGRFEPFDGTREQRVLHFWEPSEAQLAEIRGSLLVNPRGSKSKGLRGSVKEGYRTAGGLRAESASVIGYSESWSIDGLPERPVFTRDDTLGSGSTENLEGRTRYATEFVSEDGAELRGTFVRDGTRRGTFTLRRTGDLIVMGSKREADSPEVKPNKAQEPAW